jgi:actin-related protein 8
VFVVPDFFPRPHLKGLTNIFLKNMQFKSFYMHLESVLACFGTSVPSACVIDIGYEKISICCVGEGLILPGTMVRKNYGSKHINDMLPYILQTRKLLVTTRRIPLLISRMRPT